MIAIWKFPLAVDDEQQIEMPEGAELLTVMVQNANPMLWAKVDPDRPLGLRCIAVRGTGHDLNLNPLDVYIGSFMLLGGAFVGHVFDRGPG